MRREDASRGDGEHEVHRLADLEPRRSDGSGEQFDCGVVRQRIRIAGVVERVVDEHSDVVDEREAGVDLGVLPPEEAEREGSAVTLSPGATTVTS